MEAVYEFEVEDMPVTVAVDAEGNSIHQSAPLIWAQKIAAKITKLRENYELVK